MRYCFISIILSIALANASIAKASDKSLRIVASDTIAVSPRDQSKTMLRKAEVLRVINRHGNIVRIQRVDNPPDWETNSESEIRRSKEPFDTPIKSLIPLRSFQRVKAWDISARKQYTACDGSCDYGVSYFFHADGSFDATVGSNESEHSFKGHLYAHNDIYWARANKKLRASRYNIFFTQSTRETCDYISCMEQ